jgi:hypothetical protein
MVRPWISLKSARSRHPWPALGLRGGSTALFVAGVTAGKHHWELRAATGELLAVTARVHNGGRVAQAYWKLVTLTGMEAGNDIHVELRGADDRVLARITAANDAPATVTITDENGVRIAHSVREKTLLLRVKEPDAIAVHGSGDDVVARMDIDGDGPWTVHDGSGAALGELFGRRARPVAGAALVAVDRAEVGAVGRGLQQQPAARYPASDPVHLQPGRRIPCAGIGPLALLPLITGLTY